MKRSATEPAPRVDEQVESSARTAQEPHRATRVLLLIDQFYDIMGGTEQHLLFLCRNLPKVGIEVRLAVLTAVRRCSPDVFGIPTKILGPAQGRAGVAYLQRVRRLAREINAFGAEVVHAFCPLSEAAAVLTRLGGGQARIIGSRRNTGYWHRRWTRWRSRLCRYGVDHIVANCLAAKQATVAQEWYRDAQVTVIRNPIDVERLEQGREAPLAPEALGVQPGEQVVAIVATLRAVKDHPTFFQAAQAVLARRPRTRFLVVGGSRPEYAQEMQELVRSLGIQKQVTFLGPVDNPYRILNSVTVGVSSSLSEGYSNTLAEYAAAGIPTVATNVGGTPEIILDGVTGFLVPPQAPQLMAERIVDLLTNLDVASGMAIKARERAFRENAPAVVLGQYQNVYRGVLAGRTAAPHEATGDGGGSPRN